MEIEVRKVLNKVLRQFMTEDERVMVLDADLAKAGGTWDLRKDFPDRALDCGIAEANMASVAAGLSSYGFIPFIDSFTPFATRRMCDQITLSISYAKQNVKIIGTDPGISAELNGGTHMSMEDIGVLRSIPGMVIFEPVDAVQLEKALPIIKDYYGPVYIRLFRKAIEVVFDKDDYNFDLFKADVIKQGTDVTLLASGIMVQESLKAIEILEKEGISVELINVHTIKPIDKETLIASAKKTGVVVTCENHNVIGGLYSATAEVLAENYPVPMRKIGVNDRFGEVGYLPYLKDVFNLNAEDIVKTVKDAVKLKNN